MEQDITYGDRRSTRSYYDNYIDAGRADNKGRIENRDVFRKGFSRYFLLSGEMVPGTDCVRDSRNCGGVPMDYDSRNDCLFVDGSDAHTLLIGATGSKKSRLVVMPTVIATAAASESMIICDPKGEIYQRTAAHLLKEGYCVNAINLREPDKGDGWNMLDVPYGMYLEGNIDKACEYINDATINLIPITAKDPYWDYSARDMLFGLILLLFKMGKEMGYSADKVNMQELMKLREDLFVSSKSSDIKETDLWNYAKMDPLIRQRLNGTVICPEKTLACIISTFDQHMSCFSLQPQVVAMLSHSSFDLNSIGFGKNAIFLIMPDEKSTYHKIITIFIKQIYELLIDNAFKKTKNNRYPVRVNFILDEFSSLPTIQDFPQMISASRSRNIRFLLVVQSKHQLQQRYQEETETIMSNCMNWIFLTSRELGLLRDISELSGRAGSGNDSLISVSRLQHMDKEKGECLVFSGRKYPYFAYLPDIDEYDGGTYEAPKMYQNHFRYGDGNPQSHDDGGEDEQDVYNGLVRKIQEKREEEERNRMKQLLSKTDENDNSPEGNIDAHQKRFEAWLDELFAASEDEDIEEALESMNQFSPEIGNPKKKWRIQKPVG